MPLQGGWGRSGACRRSALEGEDGAEGRGALLSLSICSAPRPAPCSPVARGCRPSPTRAPRSSRTAGWGWPSALPRSGRSVSRSGPRTSQGSRWGAGCCGRGHGAISAPSLCREAADLGWMASCCQPPAQDVSLTSSGRLRHGPWHIWASCCAKTPFPTTLPCQLTPPPSMPW